MKTQAGRRLLRASLLQCLVDAPTILERQGAIGEMVALPAAQEGAQAFLAEIPAGVHKCLPMLAQLTGSNPSVRAAPPGTIVQAVLHTRQMLMAVQACLCCRTVSVDCHSFTHANSDTVAGPRDRSFPNEKAMVFRLPPVVYSHVRAYF